MVRARTRTRTIHATPSQRITSAQTTTPEQKRGQRSLILCTSSCVCVCRPPGKQHRNRLRASQAYLSSEVLEWLKQLLRRNIMAADVFSALANGEVRRNTQR